MKRLTPKVATYVFVVALVAYIGFSQYAIWHLQHNNDQAYAQLDSQRDALRAAQNGDLNNDGKVDALDLSKLSSNWSSRTTTYLVPKQVQNGVYHTNGVATEQLPVTYEQ